MPISPRKILLDTDIGSDVDDALTLAYVLRHAAFELVGISTVFGDVVLRDRIAQKLLEISGAAGVPLQTGLGVPLTPGRQGLMYDSLVYGAAIALHHTGICSTMQPGAALARKKLDSGEALGRFNSG